MTVQVTVARERLLDAIANADGTATAADDMVVQVPRTTRLIEERLA